GVTESPNDRRTGHGPVQARDVDRAVEVALPAVLLEPPERAAVLRVPDRLLELLVRRHDGRGRAHRLGPWRREREREQQQQRDQGTRASLSEHGIPPRPEHTTSLQGASPK